MQYPPLRDYGVIGTDDRCALVSRHSSVDWCWFPHLESPSVFARLLDVDSGGHFAVSPAGAYEASFEYVDRTNVLETTFETADGQATITDFMPKRNGTEFSELETDSEALFQQAIYRRLECDRGTIDLELEFTPRFDYARTGPTFERVDDGVVVSGDDERLGLYADGLDALEVTSSASCVGGSVSLEADGELSPSDFHPDHVETLFRRGDSPTA